ncbi:hypothetical protein ALO43_200059 [Pseudomonas tremae]|uniref:Single-stranded DNA-binding protein n=1 Tax=Pseudomonas tremae TaxID=200454 RepID=A0AA40TW10_9PSED|nr:hypothetical protein ALO43_200059 [Pseudomonas tremae]RMO07260.1 hypothetical protein ALQ48_200039 [Pseudomonas coronafaciens pv. zizaniae]
MKNKDPIAEAAAVAAKSHPTLMQVATQDLTALTSPAQKGMTKWPQPPLTAKLSTRWA